MLTHDLVRKIVEFGLKEDVGDGDKTSLAIFPKHYEVRAILMAKAAGVIAGLPVANMVFLAVDPNINFNHHVEDGTSVASGDVIAYIDGSACSLLTAERLALNFLQRMSGIATETAKYVKAVEGTMTRIIDTRKTAPGQRLLDKYAVVMGGGENHRMGLHDMVLIKDNHIDAAGSITEAVNRVRTMHGHTYKIEVETRNLAEVEEALLLWVDRIMLDNMPIPMMKEAVELVAGRTQLEASGGVNLETVRAIAQTGVDFISVGALTHSVRALDISMTVS